MKMMIPDSNIKFQTSSICIVVFNVIIDISSIKMICIVEDNIKSKLSLSKVASI